MKHNGGYPGGPEDPDDHDDNHDEEYLDPKKYKLIQAEIYESMQSLVNPETLVSGNSEEFSKFLDEQMNKLVVTLTYSLIQGDKS